ncbi:MAG TPA: DUF3341 domain-containing protein [Polyangiaceae bacterium]
MSATFFWELSSVDEAIAAAKTLRALGYRSLEAFTPYDVPELDELLGLRTSRVARVAGFAAVTGMTLAYGVLWYANVHDYPLDVGGRPLNSLPAHVPIMFETTVLFAALSIFLFVLLRSGLPRLHRPLFELDAFRRASDDAVWLGIDPSELNPDALERARADLPGTIHDLASRPEDR